MAEKHDPIRTAFEERNLLRAREMRTDPDLRELTRRWFDLSVKYEYSYHFTWLGRPVIQYPQDLIALQEVIWQVKPDAIIETGVAWGGSLVFYASLLALPGMNGRVLGIDIEIRPHNRKAILEHPLADRITLLEGSSVDPEIFGAVCDWVRAAVRPMVVLDSSHTSEHVRRELDLYSTLVKKDGYLIVCDTIIDEMAQEGIGAGRPWGAGNSPMTAVTDFLSSTDRFVVDEAIDDKLLITVSPRGYLKCVKD